jgi:hypothetical protein
VWRGYKREHLSFPLSAHIAPIGSPLHFLLSVRSPDFILAQNFEVFPLCVDQEVCLDQDRPRAEVRCVEGRLGLTPPRYTLRNGVQGMGGNEEAKECVFFSLISCCLHFWLLPCPLRACGSCSESGSSVGLGEGALFVCKSARKSERSSQDESNRFCISLSQLFSVLYFGKNQGRRGGSCSRLIRSARLTMHSGRWGV